MHDIRAVPRLPSHSRSEACSPEGERTTADGIQDRHGSLQLPPSDPDRANRYGGAEGVTDLIGILPEDNPLPAHYPVWLLPRMLADERPHALDRVAGIGRVRLAGHE